ncbi:MAG: ATP-binding protein [Tissierellia bacterium]|nr:ATP-binding protein [Tissierellia bacterium]MDD4780556.1 ATP-binding protein [Tissierellia bacterium]
MKIAVLSGKGGTGKTLVSVNLACISNDSCYIDCDVEEPNGHLFFKPEIENREKVTVKIPTVDFNLCNGCRKCVDFCKFNALAYINNKLFIFEKICHSCGGCLIVCPQKALTEKNKEIGEIQEGFSENVKVITGIMNIGEETGVSIIKNLLSKNIDKKHHVFIDCPPGSGCSVMESVKDADYCLLVAEPTIFGVHNFNMIYNLVKILNKPYGAVLNKCFNDRENPAEEFCLNNNIKILQKIPYDNELAKINSNGKIAVRENENYNKMFEQLLGKVKEEVRHETTVNY